MVFSKATLVGTVTTVILLISIKPLLVTCFFICMVAWFKLKPKLAKQIRQKRK